DGAMDSVARLTTRLSRRQALRMGGLAGLSLALLSACGQQAPAADKATTAAPPAAPAAPAPAAPAAAPQVAPAAPGAAQPAAAAKPGATPKDGGTLRHDPNLTENPPTLDP